MSRKQPTELSDTQIKALLRKGLAIVEREFVPEQHLPKKIYEWLQPIVNATGQGYYSTTMMILGAMAPLMNGAAVQVWNQKPSPLVAIVFQIGEAQKGKSRLFQVCEDMFEACDEVVADKVDSLLRAALGDANDSQAAAQPHPKPVTVKSITLQSFTWPEFFFRCSSAFPQVEFEEGDTRHKKVKEVWLGRAFNLDEGYEVFDGLNLMCGSRVDKDKAPCPHASTLNTLIGAGKTRRATRRSSPP